MTPEEFYYRDKGMMRLLLALFDMDEDDHDCLQEGCRHIDDATPSELDSLLREHDYLHKFSDPETTEYLSNCSLPVLEKVRVILEKNESFLACAVVRDLIKKENT